MDLGLNGELSELFADFEGAIHKAVLRVWTNISIRGCRFHQSWWRRIQKLSLIDEYKDRLWNRAVLKTFLWFTLPTAEVEDLMAILPQEERVQHFTDYVPKSVKTRREMRIIRYILGTQFGNYSMAFPLMELNSNTASESWKMHNFWLVEFSSLYLPTLNFYIFVLSFYHYSLFLLDKIVILIRCYTQIFNVSIINFLPICQLWKIIFLRGGEKGWGFDG